MIKIIARTFKNTAAVEVVGQAWNERSEKGSLSKVQKSAGRQVGWIICQPDDAKSQHIETEGGE